MVSDNRRALLIEFMQSYRATGQLFFKLVHNAAQDDPIHNMACLPVLKALKHQGSATQSAIARELHHSDAAVSRQIKILAEDELVSTRPDTSNRRATVVELTEKGEKTLKEFETIVISHLTDILVDMPDEKLKQLIDTNNELQAIITDKLGKEQ